MLNETEYMLIGTEYIIDRTDYMLNVEEWIQKGIRYAKV